MAVPPPKLLERALQQPVVLVLKDGRSIAGRLLGFDEHMNLALDGAEETSNGTTRRFGRMVVRGSNVVAIHAPSAGGKSP